MSNAKSWILDLPECDDASIATIREGTGVHAKTAKLLAASAMILREYEERVTLRQLYYQLVARGFIENSKRAYDNLIHHLTTARKSSFIPWDRFVDRARSVHAGDSISESFRLDRKPARSAAIDQVKDGFEVWPIWDLPKWWNQPMTVEVWTEKDALAGIMEPICNVLGVLLVVSRGYASYTFRREAEQRLPRGSSKILYFGDLDPSGADIPRVLAEDLPGTIVDRVALHPDQIGDLPPNFVKETDTRTNAFLTTYPDLQGTCYELDALSPPQLRQLVESAIQAEFDDDIAAERDQRIEEWRNEYRSELDRLRKSVDWDLIT